MKRPFPLTTKQEKEAPGSLRKASKKSQDLDGDASSDSYDNSYTSDTDSVSYESRKIRKKRNTYHKIPDDIRVDLLESVQNGETLKSAAKRHNINYSSAKSILHTYRKEGRILKKSVQERNFKKKSEVTEITEAETETEQIPKQKKKALKKESPHPPYLTKDMEEPLDSIPEESTTQSVHPIRKSERISIRMENGKSSHFETKSTAEELNVVQEKDHQPYQEQQSAPAMVSCPPYVQAEYQEQFYPSTEAHQPVYQNDHKLFDNFWAACPEPSFRNTAGFEETYQMDYPKEFDSFNEMMDTLQNRSSRHDIYQDANTFLCSREVNTSHLFHSRNQKTVNESHFDNSCEPPLNFAFKSFMDTHNMFRDNVRESPFGNNENTFRYRRDSGDFS